MLNPYLMVADLSAQLAAAQARIQELEAELLAQREAEAGLDLDAAPIGGFIPNGQGRHRARRTLEEVEDPLADDAEIQETQLALADKFLAQPKQVREIVRALVRAYPRWLTKDQLGEQLSTMRDRNFPPTRNAISVRVCHIRKAFGKDSVENSWGEGWRAGEPLLAIFARKKDEEAEADVDLGVSV